MLSKPIITIPRLHEITLATRFDLERKPYNTWVKHQSAWLSLKIQPIRQWPWKAMNLRKN